MPVKYKPLYCCDGCGNEFEDSDKVRIFESVVKSGDETKQYIQSGMYCISCIPLALDFANENPETVQIVESKKNLAELNTNSRLDNLEKFQQETLENLDLVTKNVTKFVDIEKLLKDKFFDLEKTTKRLDLQFENLDNKIERVYKKTSGHLIETAKNMEDDIIKEEANNFIKSQESLPTDWPHPSELVGKDDVELTERNFDEIIPETLEKISQTSSQESETRENTFDEPLGELKGRYLILRQILNENDEKFFAKKYRYKDIKDLRDACGNKSLIGLYYSSDRYSNNQNKGLHQLTVKIINKMLFGIPNIIERKVWINNNFTLIEKELFEDTIVPVTYEENPIKLPENETNIIEKTKEISNNQLKKIVSEAVSNSKEIKSDGSARQETGFRDLQEPPIKTRKQIINNTQKKPFSKKDMSDEYL